jgi:hypothetical protein
MSSGRDEIMFALFRPRAPSSGSSMAKVDEASAAGRDLDDRTLELNRRLGHEMVTLRRDPSFTTPDPVERANRIIACMLGAALNDFRGGWTDRQTLEPGWLTWQFSLAKIDMATFASAMEQLDAPLFDYMTAVDRDSCPLDRDAAREFIAERERVRVAGSPEGSAALSRAVDGMFARHRRSVVLLELASRRPAPDARQARDVSRMRRPRERRVRASGAASRDGPGRPDDEQRSDVAGEGRCA